MDWIAFPEIAKYLLWLLSTGLAFAGAWFFKFTRPHPADPDRLQLTRFGKIAFVIASISLVLGLALQVQQDREARRRGEMAAHDQAGQRQQIAKLDATLNKMVSTFLGSKEAVQEFSRLDPARRQAIAELRHDPVVRQRLAQATVDSLPELAGLDAKDILNGAPTPVLAGLQGEVMARAAHDGEAAKVEELLDSGVPVDYRSDTGVVTPLIFAVQGADRTNQSDPPSHLRVVELLLKRGADPNASYGPHQTDQKYAIDFASKHPGITKRLLDAGARVDGGGTAIQRFTPIMGAALDGEIDTVKLLLARGARTDIRSEEGETVCEVAKRAKKPAQVLALLRTRLKCAS
jgi:hypothetical protein